VDTISIAENGMPLADFKPARVGSNEAECVVLLQPLRRPAHFLGQGIRARASTGFIESLENMARVDFLRGSARASSDKNFSYAKLVNSPPCRRQYLGNTLLERMEDANAAEAKRVEKALERLAKEVERLKTLMELQAIRAAGIGNATTRPLDLGTVTESLRNASRQLNMPPEDIVAESVFNWVNEHPEAESVKLLAAFGFSTQQASALWRELHQVEAWQ
jgi:hypothetical protein